MSADSASTGSPGGDGAPPRGDGTPARATTAESSRPHAGAAGCPAHNPAVLAVEGGEERFVCGCCGAPVYAICRSCGAPVSAVETTLSRRGTVVHCGRCLQGSGRTGWVMPEAVRRKLEADDLAVRQARTLTGERAAREASEDRPSLLRRLWSLFRV